MREYMPDTGGDPTRLRQYADGALSFDDIAEDRGPRRMNTFDAIDALTFYRVARRARSTPAPGSDKYQERISDE